MAEFFGAIGGAEDEGESTDFLGRRVATAFKSQPALPAGGGPPAGAAAAPATVSGAGTVAPTGPTAGGGRAGAAGPTTLAQIAQALGLSETALRPMDWATRLFADKSTPTTPPT